MDVGFRHVSLAAFSTDVWSPRGAGCLLVGYSAPADLFSLMDNVTLWSPEGLNDPEYREYREERFGWGEADQAWADRYRACRGQALSPSANWYFTPTPSLMSRLLWDDVERLFPTDADITVGIVDQAAEYCRQLLQISEWMSPRPTSDTL